MNTLYTSIKKQGEGAVVVKKKLLIFGTGFLGEIAGYYFSTDSDYTLVGYVNEPDFVVPNSKILGVPVLETSKAIKQYKPQDVTFFVAIGYRKTNTVRQKRHGQLKDLGYSFASYISSRATVLSHTIGENCFILENNVIQPFSSIGNNVTMWSGNHLGHHSVIEDNVFIASHAVISGNCRIGRNSFLGVNCCLHDGVQIGEKSVVGASAIVGDSCEPRSVFNPQRTLPRTIKKDII